MRGQESRERRTRKKEKMRFSLFSSKKKKKGARALLTLGKAESVLTSALIAALIAETCSKPIRSWIDACPLTKRQ